MKSQIIIIIKILENKQNNVIVEADLEFLFFWKGNPNPWNNKVLLWEAYDLVDCIELEKSYQNSLN